MNAVLFFRYTALAGGKVFEILFYQIVWNGTMFLFVSFPLYLLYILSILVPLVPKVRKVDWLASTHEQVHYSPYIQTPWNSKRSSQLSHTRPDNDQQTSR
jgi:hypothetical protein